jgi:D-serine deaminase-like pyridoxal phosphate-dependent protein
VERWRRYRAALRGEPLPCALIDLDALERNVRTLTAPLAGTGKTLRLATKSLRCPELVARVRVLGGATVRGLMTYTAAETAYWADGGERDLLLGYPVAREEDAALVARANMRGARCAIVADSADHLELLAAAARAHTTTVPIVLEMDVAWRPLGAPLHIGVRRSPLRSPRDVVALARRVASTPGLRFHGLLAYEAQLAGVPDRGFAIRAMKAASRAGVERARATTARALAEAGLAPELVNGGGSGAILACAREAALTEVAAGSGFLASHLFDRIAGMPLFPAAFFALAVVRRPSARMVVCHGGGYVASGAAGQDRLPVPALPRGLRLRRLEGAGEVQTPLTALTSDGVHLSLGDPVLFRHGKTGELAEHFAEYLLVRDARVMGRAPTYRGLGKCFLG